MAVELAVADLPAAAVDGDQHRRLVETLGQIEVAEQLGTVVLGEHDVVPRRHLVSRGLRDGGNQTGRGNHGTPQYEIHALLRLGHSGARAKLANPESSGFVDSL